REASHHAAVDGAEQRGALVGRGDPAAPHVALQQFAHQLSVQLNIRSVITIRESRAHVKVGGQPTAGPERRRPSKTMATTASAISSAEFSPRGRYHSTMELIMPQISR